MDSIDHIETYIDVYDVITHGVGQVNVILCFHLFIGRQKIKTTIKSFIIKCQYGFSSLQAYEYYFSNFQYLFKIKLYYISICAIKKYKFSLTFNDIFSII